MTESQNKITRSEYFLTKHALKENEYNEKYDKTHSKRNSKIAIPRGKPKSGRNWKETKQRFSSIIKTKRIKLSLINKQKLKDDLRRVKELSTEIKALKESEKQAWKCRFIENLKRAEENKKKNEIFQVINNTAKIKRIKKKQLKFLKKRDTTSL